MAKDDTLPGILTSGMAPVALRRRLASRASGQTIWRVRDRARDRQISDSMALSQVYHCLAGVLLHHADRSPAPIITRPLGVRP
jgi:hypothetical protein